MEFSLNGKSNKTQTLNKRDVINAGKHYQQSFKQQKKEDCCFIDLSKKNSGSRFFFCVFCFFIQTFVIERVSVPCLVG